MCDYINKGKNGKPMYQDASGNPLTFWLVMTPEYGRRNRYTIPNFTGKGFIEPLVITKDGKFRPPKILEITNKAYLELGSIKRNADEPASDSAPQEIDEDLKGALGLPS